MVSGTGANSTNYIGVFGYGGPSPNNSIGVVGQGYGPSGTGVYGQALGPGGANPGNGNGVIGITGGGYGVYGYANGSGFGVSGESVTGTGIVGVSDNAGDGVWGTTRSGAGNGVHGSVDSGYGVYGTSSTGVGVYGAAPNGIGVYGWGNQYGGWFIGDVAIQGGNVVHPSDIRLKKNIQTVSGLAIITQLRGVSFDWKQNGRSSAGVIAQDVEKVMPKAVSTSPDGYKMVAYDELMAPMIEAIKELKNENDELRAEDKRLQKEIDSLKTAAP